VGCRAHSVPVRLHSTHSISLLLLRQSIVRVCIFLSFFLWAVPSVWFYIFIFLSLFFCWLGLLYWCRSISSKYSRIFNMNDWVYTLDRIFHPFFPAVFFPILIDERTRFPYHDVPAIKKKKRVFPWPTDTHITWAHFYKGKLLFFCVCVSILFSFFYFRGHLFEWSSHHFDDVKSDKKE